MGRVTKAVVAKLSSSTELPQENLHRKRSVLSDPRLKAEDCTATGIFKQVRRIDEDLIQMGKIHQREEDRHMKTLIRNIFEKLDALGGVYKDPSSTELIDCIRAQCIYAKDVYNEKVARARARKTDTETVLTDKRESLMSSIDFKLRCLTQREDECEDFDGISSEKVAIEDKSRVLSNCSDTGFLHYPGNIGQDATLTASYEEELGRGATPQKSPIEFIAPNTSSETGETSHKFTSPHSSSRKLKSKTGQRASFTPYKIPQFRKWSTQNDIPTGDCESPSKYVADVFSKLAVSLDSNNKQTSSRNLSTSGGHFTDLPQDTQAMETVPNTTSPTISQ